MDTERTRTKPRGTFHMLGSVAPYWDAVQPEYRIFRYWNYRFTYLPAQMAEIPVWLPLKEYKRVGQLLAAARERAEITQVNLASRLRKPQSFISSYEAGQRRL